MSPTPHLILQRWAMTWWHEDHESMCNCGHVGQGPTYHEVACPFKAWAWEMKARDLLRGHAPDANPEAHLRRAMS